MNTRANKKRANKKCDSGSNFFSKRRKPTFSVMKFMEDTLGGVVLLKKDQQSLVRQIRKLATIIAKMAEKNNFESDAEIVDIILVFTTTTEVISPDKNSFKYDIRLGKKGKEHLVYLMKYHQEFLALRLTNALTYFADYADDNALRDIFSERNEGNVFSSNRLILTILSFIQNNKDDQQKVPAEHLVDYLAIQCFLSRNHLIEPYLDTLENFLQDNASQRRIPDLQVREDGKFIMPLLLTNIHRRHKILSAALSDWAKQNGFPSIVKIIDSLPNKKFSTLLSKHSLIKDNANNVGDFHGAWSHAIQWFCIFEHQKSTGFLQNSPLELYKGAAPIWNDIFDILDDYDFTCPPHITKRLAQPDANEQWPLLSGSVIRAHAKMHSPHFEYKEYLRCKYGDSSYQQGFVVRKL